MSSESPSSNPSPVARALASLELPDWESLCVDLDASLPELFLALHRADERAVDRSSGRAEPELQVRRLLATRSRFG